MPETRWIFGGTEQNPNYEARAPHASFGVSQVPGQLRLAARLGGRPHMEANTDIPLAVVDAQFDAEVKQRGEALTSRANPECPALRYCGNVQFSEIPAAPSVPVTVDAEVVRYTSADGDRILLAPKLDYSAPAAGSNLVAHFDPGLLALLDGEADLYFATANGSATAKLGALALGAQTVGTRLFVGASQEHRRIDVISDGGRTGQLYFETSKFDLTLDGDLNEPVPVVGVGGGPVSATAAIRFGGRASVRAEKSQAWLRGVGTVTLQADEHDLSAGISGTYDEFYFDLVNPVIDMQLRIAPGIQIRVFKWTEEFFAKPLEVSWTSEAFTPVVVQVEQKADLWPPCLGGRFGGILVPMNVTMQPAPSPLPGKANILRTRGSDGTQAFTVNPFGSAGDRPLGLLLATVLNPYNNTSLSVDFKQDACSD